MKENIQMASRLDIWEKEDPWTSSMTPPAGIVIILEFAIHTAHLSRLLTFNCRKLAQSLRAREPRATVSLTRSTTRTCQREFPSLSPNRNQVNNCVSASIQIYANSSRLHDDGPSIVLARCVINPPANSRPV